MRCARERWGTYWCNPNADLLHYEWFIPFFPDKNIIIWMTFKCSDFRFQLQHRQTRFLQTWQNTIRNMNMRCPQQMTTSVKAGHNILRLRSSEDGCCLPLPSIAHADSSFFCSAILSSFCVLVDSLLLISLPLSCFFVFFASSFKYTYYYEYPVESR